MLRIIHSLLSPAYYSCLWGRKLKDKVSRAMIQQVRSTRDASTPFSLNQEESRARNDRQTVFALTRDLAHAQFELADQELTRRLWQEISDRNIDIERIIHLMYGCSCYEDDDAMLEADMRYQTLKRATP